MATRNIKQEFFHLLNLVATQNVKVKYCRTIKERLRPKTQEESTTLPKNRSPVKKKQDDVKSESIDKLEIKGGLTVLQSYKSKKKCRKKKETPVTPPSSKSLLRQTIYIFQFNVIFVVAPLTKQVNFDLVF